MIRLFGLLLVLILTGCSTASGPVFNESNALTKGATGIYLYRVSHLTAGFALDITIDGNKIGALKDNGYLYVNLNPGKHIITIPDRSNLLKPGTITYTFKLAPHEVQYIQVIWRPSGRMQWLSGGPVPEWNWAFENMPIDQARLQIRTTHLSIDN